MGIAGRALAERAFSVEEVTRRHLDIYHGLSAGRPPSYERAT
jgi:3-polyprenyl-4-hydroxybenzoate decarboxylase